MIKRPRITRSSGRSRPLPPSRTALPLSRTFTHDEYIALALGYKPRSPLEKWFIFMEDETLFFHRAQTGSCIFEAPLARSAENVTLRAAQVNREPQQYRSTDDEYDAALLNYLIDRFLLGRWVPLPLPRDMPREHADRHRRHVIGDADNSGDSIRLRLNTDGSDL